MVAAKVSGLELNYHGPLINGLWGCFKIWEWVLQKGIIARGTGFWVLFVGHTTQCQVNYIKPRYED